MIFKNKNLKIAILTTLIGALFIFACKYEYVNENPVCFERDVQPIIVSNCTLSGCHNAIDREKGRDYSTYDGILRDVKEGDYKSSKLYEVLVISGGDEAMPPKPYSRLSTDQIRIIASWIEEGATNDTCSASSCDTTGVMSYASRVKPILQNNCYGCHSGTASSGGGIVLSDYNNLKTSVDNGTLLGSIEQLDGYSAMPKGGSKMSNCNIAIIRKWIAAGAPNN
jgi:mono/diheme cytochrome c family protein